MNTTSSPRRPGRIARPAGALASGAVLAALLVGCGGTDEPTATDATDAASTPQSGQPRPGGQGGMPGTSGLIAAVDGDVLQVQSQMTGQVAVTVGAETTITEQGAATLADVTEGVCVVVRSADSGNTGDAGDDEDAAPTEVTAATVSLSPATADGCSAGGFGGFGGGGPGGPGGGERPTDLPTDGEGRPAGGRPGGLGAVGEVTSVDDGGFVVDGPNGAVTVTVTGDTTYTQQVEATSSALTAGRCARVEGDADDTGAVSATSIQVSDAVDDQCGR
ncbi:DUF5666 domain-containing protein [Nocardioides sp. Root190]|uniref:DUF5666 domain-containing protein n=1 Tax=Nocardioides sp. Root190 TaxID=1736488 RepID=UPI0009E9C0BF|nr:DUF5666 domain-containing protein [Nocardioides sp. Root190]